MRILLVQDTDWIKRNPHQQVHLAERMVKKGHQVHVIDYEILWKDEEKKELISKRSVHSVSKVFPDVNIDVIRPSIVKIPLLDYFSMLFTYTKEIERQIKDFKPDIIVAMDILISFLMYPIAKRHHLKVVYYTIDIDYRLIPYRFLQPLGRFIERSNMKRADKVLSINEGLRQYTIRMGTDPKKTKVIRAGIDTNRYNPKISGEKIRKRYGIKKQETLLFFMGWLYHFSGLKEVAVELSKIKRDDIKLLIVGDGDSYDDLKEIISKNHLEDKIILAGKQPYESIPEYLAAADICLLPAYNNDIMRDIVPIKMYEYMAMGNPVIATRLPGIEKEFGEDNGIIFIDDSNEAISRSLDLIQNNLLMQEGKRAFEFVQKNSWSTITDEFEEVIQVTI